MRRGLDADVDRVDFEKTFIQVVVYNFDVLKEEGNEANVRAKGKVMTKGKDYVSSSVVLMTAKGNH